jgi:hypothetical protein
MRSEITSIDPGEHVLWSGNPNPLRFSLRKSLPGALIGIPFFAFSLFWISTAYNVPSENSPLPVPFWIFGIPFVLVGSGMVLSPIWHYMRALRTSYIVTDQRAVIDYSGPFGRKVSVPLNRMPFIESRRSFGDFGHILFQEATVSSYNAGMSQRDGFVAVPAPAQVEQILRTAVDKTSGANLRKSSS